MAPRPVRHGTSRGRWSRWCAFLSLVNRASMNGYTAGSIVRMPGRNTVGQNSGGTVYPSTRISHGGHNRVEPSRNMTYQSGWLADDTTAAWYGPKIQIGLIWNRPPIS